MKKAIRRIRIWMMLEHAFNVGSDNNFLPRIAQQIAHHAYASGVRQLNKHSDVRTVISERRVRRMPDPLPTEDAAARLDFGPFGVKRVTAMTEPFRTELPCPAMAAPLYQ
jgi:hypothetical protein